MGNIFKFHPAKLIIGILISKEDLKESLIQNLTEKWGPIDFESPLIDFSYSQYYNKEMGSTIKKFFISFQNLVSGDSIMDTKIYTNIIEEKYSISEKRKVNLDPGHMFLSKFILSTTKDGSHRIPLGKGIYAEITLLFQKNSFRPLEWTYPDFRDSEYIKILNHIRQIYKPQLKSEFDLTKPIPFS